MCLPFIMPGFISVLLGLIALRAAGPAFSFFLALGFEPLSTMWIWTGDE